MRAIFILLLTSVPWSPAAVSAQEAAAPGPNPVVGAEAEEPEAWETSLEMNFATAYVWRGLNLLGQGNQRYSPGVFLPEIGRAHV